MSEEDVEQKNQMYEEHPFRIHRSEQWIEEYNSVNGKRILVAGCGGGERVLKLSARGAEVTAIDQSNAAISFLEEAFEDLHYEKPELLCEKLQEVNLSADEFDYIYCIGVLHHMESPKDALKLFQESCKPNGTVEVYVYNSRSPRMFEEKTASKLTSIVPIGRVIPHSMKQRINWWDKFENPVVNPYSKEELTSDLRESGLAISDVEYTGSLFSSTLNSFIPPVIDNVLSRFFEKQRGGITVYASPKE